MIYVNMHATLAIKPQDLPKLFELGIFTHDAGNERDAVAAGAPHPGAEEPPKLQVNANAYGWFKETHGQKLTADMVAAAVRESGHEPSGKSGRYTLKDIQALFPEPQQEPPAEVPPAEEPPAGDLTMDDLREATNDIINAKGDEGRKFALSLIRETYDCKQLSKLPEEHWSEYVAKLREETAA